MLNISKKIAAIVFALVVCLIGLPMAVSAASQPTYVINGTVEGDTFTVDISIQNAQVLGGRLALAYDNKKLELLEQDGDEMNAVGKNPTYSAVLRQSSLAVVTPESNKAEDLISTKDGYLLMAWYAADNSIDATQSPQKLATVSFRIKSDKFDARTLFMKDMRSGEIQSWNTGAYVAAKGMVEYKSNVAGYPSCAATFSYPKVEVIPAGWHNVTLAVENAEGQGLQASYSLNGQEDQTDVNGRKDIMLPAGAYTVGVWSDNYEKVFVELDVKKDTTETIVLRNDAQMVQYVAENIAINYVEGNSVNKVTDHVGLPKTGAGDTTITWQSSNTNIIDHGGAFVAPANDTAVKLTATVVKNEALAQREFTLHTKGFLIAMPGQPDLFLDLEDVEWAREAILALQNIGIIRGTSATTYSPQLPITRGDFLTLIMRTYEPEAAIDDNFVDVPQDSYYYEAIGKAKALGIAEGYGNGQFNPEDSITRQDMMTITYRALNVTDPLSKRKGDTSLENFLDKDTVADYAQDAVSYMIGQGYIIGDQNKNIQPNQNTTRAEIAVFIYRLYLDKQ